MTQASDTPPTPTTLPDTTAPFAAYPGLYAAADTLAEQFQDRQQWVVRFNLLLIVVNTGVLVLAALDRTIDALFPLISAVLLAVGFVSQVVVRRRPVDKSWFHGRALAEAVKGATWRYIEGAKPYNGAAAEAGTRFTADLRLLREQHGGNMHGLDILPVAATQVTRGMRIARTLPLAERRHLYLHERADDQITWYTRRAADNRRRGDRLYWAAQTAQVLTLLVAFGRAVWHYPYAVIGLFGMFAAIATAWNQNGRHGELAATYSATADALVASRARIATAETDAALDEAVTGAEDAIAREQAAWVIKRT